MQFAALEEVCVGGEWVRVARTYGWALRSLVSLSIRDGPLTGRSSFASGCYGMYWRRSASALRSLTYDDSGCWDFSRSRAHPDHLAQLLRPTNSVPHLHALKRLRFTSQQSCFTHGGTQLLAQRGLRLEEVDIALSPGYLSTQNIKDVDDFRRLCLAPSGTEDWSRSNIMFELPLLWQNVPTEPVWWANGASVPTVQLLASAATHVGFGTYWPAGETFPALYSTLASLVFCRAQELILFLSSPSTDIPEAVVADVPRLLPCVRRAELLFEHLADLSVQRMLSQLPMLEALVNTFCVVDYVGEVEMCMWVDQTEKDRPIDERVHRIIVHSHLHYEQGDTESFDFYCGETVWNCVQAIGVFPRLDSIDVDITVEGHLAGGDIVSMLQEVTTCRPDLADDHQVAFHLVLHDHGFEMVELPRLAFDCRVEVRRLGLPVPSQKRITDYFSVANQ